VETDAYESYLKGRFYWRMPGRENMVTAAGYFERAIVEDPAFAPAYSGLSDFHRQSTNSGLARPRDCMPKAEAAARKALELDDGLAEAHASLAGVLYRYRWDWEGADREFRRALALDPSAAETYRAYAVYLLTVHRDDEALAALRRARELSPLSPVIAVEAGYAAARAGRFAEADQHLRRARALDPRFGRIDNTLALQYVKQGEPVRAADLLARGRAARREGSRGDAWAGFVYAMAGRGAEARAELLALEERARREPVSPQLLAVVRVALGERERALALLEQAVDERDIEVLGFSGPLFDELRDDARYRALVMRMGLAEAYFPG
jgi:serine/threonine-protein kinase